MTFPAPPHTATADADGRSRPAVPRGVEAYAESDAPANYEHVCGAALNALGDR